MRIGNDIIDLSACRDHHPRFAERILSEAELDHLLDQKEDERTPLLWCYWAAKEAAYKAYVQSQPVSFSPKQWEINPEFTEVRFAESSLPLRLWREGDMVLAEVSDQDWGIVHHRVQGFSHEPNPRDQSAEAANLALSLGETVLNVPRHKLSIRKQGRIPRLLDDSSGSSFPMSLSHHGRYVACVFAGPTASRTLRLHTNPAELINPVMQEYRPATNLAVFDIGLRPS